MSKFTRKAIREIIGDSCTEEIENGIVALYLGVVDPMKDEISDLKAKAEKLDEVTKELETLKKVDYKKKYDDLNKEYSDYKASKEKEAERTAKEEAVKAYFEGKHIIGKNLEIAMRGAKDEINGITLKDGKIEDTASLDGLVAGTFASLIVTESTKGADTATPPSGGGGKTTTKEDILKMTDYHKQIAAIKENPDLFK